MMRRDRVVRLQSRKPFHRPLNQSLWFVALNLFFASMVFVFVYDLCTNILDCRAVSSRPVASSATFSLANSSMDSYSIPSVAPNDSPLYDKSGNPLVRADGSIITEGDLAAKIDSLDFQAQNGTIDPTMLDAFKAAEVNPAAVSDGSISPLLTNSEIGAVLGAAFGTALLGGLISVVVYKKKTAAKKVQALVKGQLPQAEVEQLETVVRPSVGTGGIVERGTKEPALPSESVSNPSRRVSVTPTFQEPQGLVRNPSGVLPADRLARGAVPLPSFADRGDMAQSPSLVDEGVDIDRQELQKKLEAYKFPPDPAGSIIDSGVAPSGDVPERLVVSLPPADDSLASGRDNGVRTKEKGKDVRPTVDLGGSDLEELGSLSISAPRLARRSSSWLEGEPSTSGTPVRHQGPSLPAQGGGDRVRRSSVSSLDGVKSEPAKDRLALSTDGLMASSSIRGSVKPGEIRGNQTEQAPRLASLSGIVGVAEKSDALKAEGVEGTDPTVVSQPSTATVTPRAKTSGAFFVGGLENVDATVRKPADVPVVVTEQPATPSQMVSKRSSLPVTSLTKQPERRPRSASVVDSGPRDATLRQRQWVNGETDMGGGLGDAATSPTRTDADNPEGTETRRISVSDSGQATTAGGLGEKDREAESSKGLESRRVSVSGFGQTTAAGQQVLAKGAGDRRSSLLTPSSSIKESEIIRPRLASLSGIVDVTEESDALKAEGVEGTDPTVVSQPSTATVTPRAKTSGAFFVGGLENVDATVRKPAGVPVVVTEQPSTPSPRRSSLPVASLTKQSETRSRSASVVDSGSRDATLRQRQGGSGGKGEIDMGGGLGGVETSPTTVPIKAENPLPTRTDTDTPERTETRRISVSDSGQATTARELGGKEDEGDVGGGSELKTRKAVVADSWQATVVGQLRSKKDGVEMPLTIVEDSESKEAFDNQVLSVRGVVDGTTLSPSEPVLVKVVKQVPNIETTRLDPVMYSRGDAISVSVKEPTKKAQSPTATGRPMAKTSGAFFVGGLENVDATVRKPAGVPVVVTEQPSTPSPRRSSLPVASLTKQSETRSRSASVVDSGSRDATLRQRQGGSGGKGEIDMGGGLGGVETSPTTVPIKAENPLPTRTDTDTPTRTEMSRALVSDSGQATTAGGLGGSTKDGASSDIKPPIVVDKPRFLAPLAGDRALPDLGKKDKTEPKSADSTTVRLADKDQVDGSVVDKKKDFLGLTVDSKESGKRGGHDSRLSSVVDVEDDFVLPPPESDPEAELTPDDLAIGPVRRSSLGSDGFGLGSAASSASLISTSRGVAKPFDVKAALATAATGFLAPESKTESVVDQALGLKEQSDLGKPTKLLESRSDLPESVEDAKVDETPLDVDVGGIDMPIPPRARRDSLEDSLIMPSRESPLGMSGAIIDEPLLFKPDKTRVSGVERQVDKLGVEDTFGFGLGWERGRIQDRVLHDDFTGELESDVITSDYADNGTTVTGLPEAGEDPFAVAKKNADLLKKKQEEDEKAADEKKARDEQAAKDEVERLKKEKLLAEKKAKDEKDANDRRLKEEGEAKRKAILDQGLRKVTQQQGVIEEAAGVRSQTLSNEVSSWAEMMKAAKESQQKIAEKLAEKTRLENAPRIALDENATAVIDGLREQESFDRRDLTTDFEITKKRLEAEALDRKMVDEAEIKRARDQEAIDRLLAMPGSDSLEDSASFDSVDELAEATPVNPTTTRLEDDIETKAQKTVADLEMQLDIVKKKLASLKKSSQGDNGLEALVRKKMENGKLKAGVKLAQRELAAYNNIVARQNAVQETKTLDEKILAAKVHLATVASSPVKSAIPESVRKKTRR